MEIAENLTEAPPSVSERHARRIAVDCFGLSAHDLRPLPGERDQTFRLRDDRGRELVLKIVHPGENPAVTDFQTAALLHVAAADPSLRTPRVVAPLDGKRGWTMWRSDAGVDHAIRCVTYLNGRSLHETTPTPAQRRNIGAFLARLDLALDGFRHTADSYDLLWDVKQADRARHLLVAVRDPGRRALAERLMDRFTGSVAPRLRALRSQVIHNDFNPHNILIDPEATDRLAGIIDFGDVIRAPLIQDLGTACAYHVPARGHPLAAAAELASGFHAVCPLDEEELAILPDIMATRLALSGAITSWRARRHPANAAYILRNSRAAWSGMERLDELEPGAAAAWLVGKVVSA